MPSDIQTLKAGLRKGVRAQLNSMTPAMRTAGSAGIRASLGAQPVWKSAQSILFYAPMAEEPDIWPLIGDSLAAGKLIALPRFDATSGSYAACQIGDPAGDVVNGRFGIREPGEHCGVVPLDRFDLVLVPGMAFDTAGHRLGRGKGFYDRLLPLVRGTKCGVAFDEQIVEGIPVEPHDVVLDCVQTPKRWIETER